MLQSIDASAGRSPQEILPLLVAKAATRDFVRKWAGVTLSVAILIAVAIQVRGIDFGKILSIAPGFSSFWIVFLCFYLLVPLSHWVIYRQIWRLGPRAIVPLLRKQVANEVVLGYSGEAHFYFWARQHAGLTGSPFGAIKDVSMLSAIAGNIVTLVLMAVMAPTIARIMTGTLATTFQLSVMAVVILSLAPFVFGRRLFSLTASVLTRVFAVHLARLALIVILSAVMWHILLPTVPVAVWLSLATLKLMISRLPLVANKDVLFAAATMLLLGKEADVAAAVALTSSLTLLAHVSVGLVTALYGLIERSEPAQLHPSRQLS
ncbi:MAG: hypothetical protein J0J06_12375 [Sphingomonas sp.]|uniref:hypothetical protein n=1 Tax=Sphingomonas sp. TaxID=28214 RepID=UPI001AC02BE5|nr:hypothetical protein [Sphingomonas sp.]MBN8816231.1 hypothetical protein [Sphingomonas sp.]